MHRVIAAVLAATLCAQAAQAQTAPPGGERRWRRPWSRPPPANAQPASTPARVDRCSARRSTARTRIFR